MELFKLIQFLFFIELRIIFWMRYYLVCEFGYVSSLSRNKAKITLLVHGNVEFWKRMIFLSTRMESRVYSETVIDSESWGRN